MHNPGRPHAEIGYLTVQFVAEVFKFTETARREETAVVVVPVYQHAVDLFRVFGRSWVQALPVYFFLLYAVIHVHINN